MPSLADLLARESSLVREFIARLTREQDALKRGETDALIPLALEKTELVEQLNAVESERNSFLRLAGYAGNHDGISAWLAKNQDDVAAEQWDKLLKLAAEARQINDLNGRLITMRLQVTNQALDILMQQPQRSTLYGRDGLTTPRTGSRIIDAA